MARAVVLEIIEQFRSQFQGQVVAEVPLALRQEAPDVVFTALLEEDKPAQPLGGPLVGDLGLSEVPPELSGGGGAQMTLDDLLGASEAPTEGMADPLSGLSDPLGGGLGLADLPPEF